MRLNLELPSHAVFKREVAFIHSFWKVNGDQTDVANLEREIDETLAWYNSRVVVTKPLNVPCDTLDEFKFYYGEDALIQAYNDSRASVFFNSPFLPLPFKD